MFLMHQSTNNDLATITISVGDWRRLTHELSETGTPRATLIMRGPMKRDLGFTTRSGRTNDDLLVMHLDWFCPEKRTMFLLRFGGRYEFIKSGLTD